MEITDRLTGYSVKVHSTNIDHTDTDRPQIGTDRLHRYILTQAQTDRHTQTHRHRHTDTHTHTHTHSHAETDTHIQREKKTSMFVVSYK